MLKNVSGVQGNLGENFKHIYLRHLQLLELDKFEADRTTVQNIQK